MSADNSKSSGLRSTIIECQQNVNQEPFFKKSVCGDLIILIHVASNVINRIMIFCTAAKAKGYAYLNLIFIIMVNKKAVNSKGNWINFITTIYISRRVCGCHKISLII